MLLFLLAFAFFTCDALPQAAVSSQGNAPSGTAVARPMIMPGGFPTPIQCDDNEGGYLNGTCKSDADCIDPNSMTCIKNRCKCAKDYTENVYDKRTCMPLPYLYSPCTTVCQKPYECKEGNPGAVMTPETAVASDMAVPPQPQSMPMPPPPPYFSKTCQCPGKSRLVNGYCDAGCKSDQRVGAGGKCVPKCVKDQILLDGECKPLADIGGACDDTAQCKPAFSSCDGGKCKCVSGFQKKGSSCQPKSYSCPFGDPLKKGDNVVLCETTQQVFIAWAAKGGAGGAAMESAPPPPRVPMKPDVAISSSRPSSNSCPSNHYCHAHDQNGYPTRGHCCPRPAAKCPVGDPHPSATCNGQGQQCPWTTHSCLNVGAPNDFGANMLCCPKACPGNNKIFVKDQCLPLVQYGEGCSANEQCQNLNGICSSDKCTCPKKATAIDNGGGNKYCQLNCGQDEIQIGTECKSRLKLGDTCTGESSMFCPIGAQCGRKGKCECICGYKKQGNTCVGPVNPVPVDGGAGGGVSGSEIKPIGK